MQDLQLKIKSKWHPPKGEESKKIVLYLKVNKDGSLANVKVKKSSNIQDADNAAIQAVKAAAPFDHLPKAYKYSNVDIEFAFDYNVFH